MAHEILIENGKYSMMYIGEKPWHGLGQQLSSPATAAEAIEASNLNWKVMKQPIYAGDADKQLVKDRFAVVREDLWEKKMSPVFGIVGKEYTPLQNHEAFNFFDDIVGKKAAIYHTAGALGDGERVWILAKLPSDIQVIGDDIAEKYLLLSNSHDGNSSVQIKFTPIRVVCNNTLTMALNNGPTLRVPHTKDLHNRLREVEKLMGIVHKRFDQIEDTFKEMSKIQLNREKLSNYLEFVFPNPKNPDDKRNVERIKRERSMAEYFFESGRGNQLPGVGGTLWAAYNGITELIDHRQTRQSDDRRLNSLWFGEGYLTKAKAYNLAEQKIKAWKK
jgi:phage/plasmid-like protein (TIGR03299 family)